MEDPRDIEMMSKVPIDLIPQQDAELYGQDGKHSESNFASERNNVGVDFVLDFRVGEHYNRFVVTHFTTYLGRESTDGTSDGHDEERAKSCSIPYHEYADLCRLHSLR